MRGSASHLNFFRHVTPKGFRVQHTEHAGSMLSKQFACWAC